jgi:hypothetical protein
VLAVTKQTRHQHHTAHSKTHSPRRKLWMTTTNTTCNWGLTILHMHLHTHWMKLILHTLQTETCLIPNLQFKRPNTSCKKFLTISQILNLLSYSTTSRTYPRTGQSESKMLITFHQYVPLQNKGTYEKPMFSSLLYPQMLSAPTGKLWTLSFLSSKNI